MKYVLTAVLAAFLAGCTTTKAPIVVPESVLTQIPEDLLRCNGVKWPKPDTLTDKEVAKLIVRLDAALKKCKGNVDAIRELQRRLKQVYAKKA